GDEQRSLFRTLALPLVQQLTVAACRRSSEHYAKAAHCPAAYQVAVAVIDLLRPIQVQQQNSKRPSRAPRSFDLRTEDVYDPTIVAKAGKGIGNGQESCLRFHSFTLGQVESREIGRASCRERV